jgi:hypothetical protein
LVELRVMWRHSINADADNDIDENLEPGAT